MKPWKLALITTLLTLAIGGTYLYTVWRHRQDPGELGRSIARQKKAQNEQAVVRTIAPVHFEDTLALQGKSVWMKNGNTISYYPYAGGRVNFSKAAGTVPPLQRLDIKKIIKSPVPVSVFDGISSGSRQAFAVFALPGNAALYAMPIGAMQGDEEAYFCDVLYYYDDPHSIYDNWPKDVWAAIDAHRVKPGMSELQARMAVGQKMHPDRVTTGDRTVTYDDSGKQWTVTFADNRATAVASK